MKTIIYVILCSLIIGCSANNRNIVTTINSGVGISVSYNPQTQLPETKMGWIRSSFFLVPTSLNTGDNGYGGTASDTPTMIAHQKISVGVVEGISIDDKFILGKNITPDHIEQAKYMFSSFESFTNGNTQWPRQ